MIHIDFNDVKRTINERSRDEAKQTIQSWKDAFTAYIKINGASDVSRRTISDMLYYQSDLNLRKRLDSIAESACLPDGVSVIETICSGNDLSYALIQKNATRTGFQEKTQFDALSENSTTTRNWVNLPSRGNGVKYLENINGTCRLTGTRAGRLKSVDFICELNTNMFELSPGTSVTIAVCAKYTESDGGAQDNQMNDLISFASVAQNKIMNGIDNILVALLADGDYYERHSMYARFPPRRDKMVFMTPTSLFDETLTEWCRLNNIKRRKSR